MLALQLITSVTEGKEKMWIRKKNEYPPWTGLYVLLRGRASARRLLDCAPRWAEAEHSFCLGRRLNADEDDTHRCTDGKGKSLGVRNMTTWTRQTTLTRIPLPRCTQLGTHQERVWGRNTRAGSGVIGAHRYCHSSSGSSDCHKAATNSPFHNQGAFLTPGPTVHI